MRHLFILWAASVAVQVGLSSQIPLDLESAYSSYSVKETHNLPPKWTDIGPPHPMQMINLHIGLKQGNFPELQRHLYEVSDPFHPRYGQHLSKEQVEELVRPNDDASSQVSEWLEVNGIFPEHCEFSPAGDWVSVSLPVSSVEYLLDAQYSVYEHEDGSRLVRTTSWSLPVHLHEHITTIQPTTAFLRANPKGETVKEVPGSVSLPEPLPAGAAGIAQVCNFSSMTPLCLRTLYNTVNYKPQVPGKNSIGFTNYLGQVANRSDAAIFVQQFRPEAVSSARSFQQISIAGGPVDNGTAIGGLEGNLDVETILGIVWPTPTISYSTGGKPPFKPDSFTQTNTNEPYLTWLTYVLALPSGSVPQVISTSYGDDEQTVPLSYAVAVCNSLAQLGARGHTLFFSSGDNGVGGNGSCITNDGHNTSSFLPAFPASCPYITAVGGTRDYPEIVAFDPVNGYASGSGFSNYFAQPKFQRRSPSVQAYLSHNIPTAFNGLYNKSGRAYPDLAAQSYKFATVFAGVLRHLDGTSAAAPTVSSIFALVNDALLAAGKPPLGWLNPWLYSVGHKAFNDVVDGSSIGCDGSGFAASKGWDVASGWGTPDFERILVLLGL